MTYKNLKRSQLNNFKKQNDFTNLIKSIIQADLTAFGDLRNLIFDRELGTNILTEFVTGKDQDSQNLIEILYLVKEFMEPILPSIMEALTNVPDKQSSTIGLKVLSKLKFSTIE